MNHARHAAPTRVNASRLSLTWLGWLAVAVAALGVAVPGLIENFRALAEPPAEARQALESAMLSAGAHALYHTAIDVLFALGAIAVSAWILLRNPGDRTCASAALVLAGWGPLNGLATEAALQGPVPLRIASVASWVGVGWLIFTAVSVHGGGPSLRQRQQLRWLLYGLTTSSVLTAGIALLVGTGATLEPDQVDRHMSGHLLLALAGGLFPWAAWTAWGRASVPDPDTLTRRTLVYGVLTTIVAGLTISLVFLPALLYYELGPVYLLTVVCAWAILGLPLQQWVQRTVNRMLYGQREEPIAVLVALGERLELGSPETVLNAIVETVATTLKLPAVRIVSESGGVLASIGESSLESARLPILHHGEQVGTLAVSPRARDEALDDHDVRILRLVARQAGPTVRAVQLNQELRRSRQEILEGREEERRRIRRDLHDGLGPALAAIAMQADTARAVVDDDPAAARELMAAITDQAKDVVEDVRRLVYELRPPALDQLGLIGAIESLARQHSSATLRVDVRAPGSLPALNAALEVATFRIVSEALNNVSRHAAADRCEVWLELRPAELNVIVEDNGCGIDPAAAAGIGLRSMADRASEVAGNLEVAPGKAGGTRVRLTLPLPVSATAEESLP